jgi:hypothetical protein
MTKTMTPVSDANVLLDFPDAIREVIDGKRIARVDWKNADYGVLKDGWLKIFHKKEGQKLSNFHTWLINDGDLTADDWIVLPDLS